jgi:hypothetical protein
MKAPFTAAFQPIFKPADVTPVSETKGQKARVRFTR